MSEPVNKLQKWFNEHPIDDKMRWKGASEAQVMFVRDELVPLVGMGLIYQEQEEIVDVISTHMSKSITLPVVEIIRADLGLRLTMRDNFHNWKLSVCSENPIEADFSGIFHTTPPIDPSYTGNELASVYFEGFPEDRIYRYYSEDRRKFSAEIHGDHAMWTTVFLIMRAVGAITASRWHTRESHEVALAERAARERAWKERNAT